MSHPIRRSLFAVTLAIFFAGTCVAVDEAPLTRLRKQVHELLKQHAHADTVTRREESVAALCDMFVVLRGHEKYTTSQMVRGDATKVRRRLLNIAKTESYRLKRARIERPPDLSQRVESVLESTLSKDQSLTEVLAPTKGQADSLNSTQASGPMMNGGGGGMLDQGWQLVELIQRIVSPDFWDSAGGPGSVRYFAMRRVLVIRATSDTHKKTRDLLNALR